MSDHEFELGNPAPRRTDPVRKAPDLSSKIDKLMVELTTQTILLNNMSTQMRQLDQRLTVIERSLPYIMSGGPQSPMYTAVRDDQA